MNPNRNHLSAASGALHGCAIALTLVMPCAIAQENLPSVTDIIATQRASFAGLQSIQYTCEETFSTRGSNLGAAKTLKFRKKEILVQAGQKYRFDTSVTDAEGNARSPGRAIGFDGEVHYRIFGRDDSSGREIRSAEAPTTLDSDTLPAYLVPFARNVYRPEDWENHHNFGAGDWLAQEEAWSLWALHGRVVGRETVDGIDCTVLRVEYHLQSGATESPGYAMVYLANAFGYFPVATNGFEYFEGGERQAIHMSAAGLYSMEDSSGLKFTICERFESVGTARTGESIEQKWTFDRNSIRIDEPINEEVFRFEMTDARLLAPKKEILVRDPNESQ